MLLGVTNETIWGRPRNVCRRSPQDVGRGCPLTLHIVHYGDVLRTSYFNVQRTSIKDVLRTSAGDVPWRYMKDYMGTSIGHLLGSGIFRAGLFVETVSVASKILSHIILESTIIFPKYLPFLKVHVIGFQI